MSFYYLCMLIWGRDWNRTMNNGLQYYPRAITPTPWYVLYHQPPFPNHQDALLTVHKVFSAQKTVCFKKVRYRYLTKDVLIENTIHCEYKPHWAGCPGKEARLCPETWAALYTRRNIPQCYQKVKHDFLTAALRSWSRHEPGFWSGSRIWWDIKIPEPEPGTDKKRPDSATLPQMQ